MITNMSQVYDFIQQIIKICNEQEQLKYISVRLEHVLSLGSSGLEILGAIGTVLSEERHRFKETTIDLVKIEEVIQFANKSFGCCD